ncbi:LexA family transcriptional regulator [Nitratidesulfovibrio vulgaris]|uniref:LexA family transcriptional regulator n=1 Tax=Nitratidesulfovibrio vulgaris TaxID=881 RepID=UPI00230162B5|nr:S24 family peptidase [Nitratidesulfovibrio vulgaris]WCB45063.1 S24 family peptidase [Nitratidesulfovibrio vulgaris]
MSFQEEIVRALREFARTKFGGNHRAAAEALGVNPVTFWRWMTGERTPKFELLGKAMDALGATVSLPGDTNASSREVCWVDAKVVAAGEGLLAPDQEDYYAVPLVDEAGAGPGIIPQGQLLSWFLVWKHQESIRYRSDLIAVRIARGSDSMVPTLAPGDIVLVDRQDKNADRPGRIMLVMDPDGAGKVKRVHAQHVPEEKDYRLTYYSDNAAAYPPEVYSLKRDFDSDWHRAIVGRVIWAWSDVSGK